MRRTDKNAYFYGKCDTYHTAYLFGRRVRKGLLRWRTITKLTNKLLKILGFSQICRSKQSIVGPDDVVNQAAEMAQSLQRLGNGAPCTSLTCEINLKLNIKSILILWQSANLMMWHFWEAWGRQSWGIGHWISFWLLSCYQCDISKWLILQFPKGLILVIEMASSHSVFIPTQFHEPSPIFLLVVTNNRGMT